MARQTNPTTSASEEAGVVSPFQYEIVGLEKSEYMPINYDGRTYNLAALTPEEAAFLINEGPEKVPFLRRI